MSPWYDVLTRMLRWNKSIWEIKRWRPTEISQQAAGYSFTVLLTTMERHPIAPIYVHHSPIFQTHIGAPKTLLARKLKAAMNKTKGVSDPQVPNEDFDGDQNDIDLEMNIEQATFPSRMVQQALWLAIPCQQAMEVVTNCYALPEFLEFPVLLTFWEPPTKRSITEMKSWTDVIHSMYPSITTPSVQPPHNKRSRHKKLSMH